MVSKPYKSWVYEDNARIRTRLYEEIKVLPLSERVGFSVGSVASRVQGWG